MVALFVVLLAGVSINADKMAQAGNPIHSFSDAKAAIVRSWNDREPVDYSKMN